PLAPPPPPPPVPPPRPGRPLPRQAARGPPADQPARRAAAHRSHAPRARRSLHHALGRLRQAPVRGRGAALPVPRPLHPPRRPLKPASRRRHGGRRGVWPPGQAHRHELATRGLAAATPDAVTFRAKDRRTATLHPHEFLRRFLLHVLPSGFVK